MKHEDYVNFEQAKTLKELRFDWEVLHFYALNDVGEPLLCREPFEFGCSDNHNRYDGYTSAPTLSTAQKWLREVKGIDISVLRYIDFYEYKFQFKNKILYSDLFDTYEQALSAGIDLALKFLKKE